MIFKKRNHSDLISSCLSCFSNTTTTLFFKYTDSVWAMFWQVYSKISKLKRVDNSISKAIAMDTQISIEATCFASSIRWIVFLGKSAMSASACWLNLRSFLSFCKCSPKAIICCGFFTLKGEFLGVIYWGQICPQSKIFYYFWSEVEKGSNALFVVD